MRPVAEAPRLLFSARPLAGVSLATRDRMLEVVARYREHESLAVTVSKALDAGADGILSSALPVLQAARRELKRAVPTYLVVPAITELERHRLEPGAESVLARPHARPGFVNRMRLGLPGLIGSAALFGGNLAARLPLVIQSEVSKLPARDLRGVVLDAWLTDVALAASHRRFFEGYVRLVRRRFGAAGFETHNLGTLLARLDEWGVTPDFVVGPVNPHGLSMKPSPDESLAAIARSEVRVVAKELRAGGMATLRDGARFAHAHGAYGLAPDVAELEDVGTELKALGAEMALAN